MGNPQSQALGIPALEHQHTPPPLQTSVLPGQSMDDAHRPLVTAHQVQLGRFQWDQAGSNEIKHHQNPGISSEASAQQATLPPGPWVWKMEPCAPFCVGIHWASFGEGSLVEGIVDIPPTGMFFPFYLRVHAEPCKGIFMAAKASLQTQPNLMPQANRS